MLKLRKTLLCNKLYYLILIFITILSFIRIKINKPNTSKYSNEIKGIVQEITIKENKLKLIIKSDDRIICTYYFKEKQELLQFKKNIKLGDELKLKGKINIPKENTTKYLFNYKKYLSSKKIFYILNINSYQKLKNNNNIYYYVKQKIIEYFDEEPYLNTFLLGNKNYINKEIQKSYQTNGISHLFAISGMHISIFSTIILKLLKPIKKEKKKYFITCLVLVFYLLIVGLSPSIVRGVLFFILFSINKIYYFYITPINIYFLTLGITLLINPFYIYDIGFQYSFLISFALIYLSDKITGKYIYQLLKVTLISITISIPISLSNFYQINILSIILNIFFVPLITYIIFPLTLLTSIFKFLLPIYKLIIVIMEKLSLKASEITIFQLNFIRLPNYVYYIYLILILIIYINIKTNKTKENKKYIVITSMILINHYIYQYVETKDYIKMIDIGQGDSILLHSNHESVLIDTGGKLNFKPKWVKEDKTNGLAENTTLPLLKSLGIKKLKYLIITHGDADHIGEALNILKNIPVEKIILNQGKINYLEYKIIKNNYPVIISKELNEINCGEIYLIELNKKYNNENDSSQFYLGTYKNKNILLTGDASSLTEKNILKKYNLPKIDLLKVGHHGSKTSTSIELLEKTNPKISIISAGYDNKFKHPHKITIDNLKKYKSKYYITSINGTITYNLNTGKIIADKNPK